MSDLINRQQAIDALEEQLDYLMLNKKDNPTAESKWHGVNWARNMIAELPTIDLVRCGECKYGTKIVTTGKITCGLDRQVWEKTDFCSYGERNSKNNSNQI